MEIKFLNTRKKYSISKNSDNNFNLDNFNLDNFNLDNEKIELQEKILNSLNYLSNNNLLPTLLPNTLNVKFIGNSILEKIKVNLYGDPIAQLKIPNTLFISPQLLPNNITENNKNLPYYLNSHFKNKNQVFDLVLFHEIGHVIFNHNFSNFNNMNEQLFASRSYFKKLQHSFKTNYNDIPLYQINRSIEEQFADSFSCLALSHRYNTEIQKFIDLRNDGDPNLYYKRF